ncbi:MAG: hypothetical protein HYZ27_06845, partial [Deltaproteobacteria bacterium]|nr:hypothetical protein [Deltaproteobacteria bacterium]
PIRVTFDNDAVLGSEDRNLYVDKLVAECGSTTTTPPPTSTCTSTTYEAETMSRTTGGATSGGWNLWSNGSLSTSHRFLGGPVHVAVTAKGSSAGGVWPRMRLYVGGELLGTVTVGSTSWKEYVFEVAPAAATSELRVTFDNDAVIGSEDRNLYVDKVVARCP